MALHIQIGISVPITKGVWDIDCLHYGGFQLEDLSISQVINMWPDKNSSSHIGGKSVKKSVKNPLQDLLSSLNAVISTNESTEFITGHVIYNPAYTYKFQLNIFLDMYLSKRINLVLDSISTFCKLSFSENIFVNKLVPCFFIRHYISSRLLL